MKTNCIEFDNVSFDYSYEPDLKMNRVIDSLSLKIKKGEFVAVLGHNGSGKSTFAKLSNAILTPDSGKVLVDGLDTSLEENKFKVREKVGMVFQNPDNQIVATVVEEDVAFGPENLGIVSEEIQIRVDFALKNVGMEKYRFHEPHKLSGGQKQKVAIAGIIAMQPDYIVLDEATAMLDPQGRKDVMSTIKSLNKNFGISIIYITHYMEEAVCADRVIVMEKGKIFMDDEPKKIFSREVELKSIGLDVPSISSFAIALSKKGINIGNNILTTDECVDGIIKFFDGQVKLCP